MDILEKDTNTKDNDKAIIEKVNEDFLDTIKQALHISNGLLCDLTDEELHDIKALQKDAYKNLKGDTDFNLYPLCLAELYKNILDNIYKHQIDDYKKEQAETNLNDYNDASDNLDDEASLTEENIEDDEFEKAMRDEEKDREYIESCLREFTKTNYDDDDKEDYDYLLKEFAESATNKNEDELDGLFFMKKNEEDKNNLKEDNAEQNKDFDSGVVQRFDISLDEDDSQNKNKETDSFMNPFPEEEELEDNSELLKHVDTLEILSDEDTQNFSLEEIHEEENRKVITSESIEERTTDKAFTNEAESIEDVLPDEGIEIKNEIEDEPVDFSNLKFFSDRNIDD